MVDIPRKKFLRNADIGQIGHFWMGTIIQYANEHVKNRRRKMAAYDELVQLIANTFKIDCRRLEPKTHFFQDMGADSLELLSLVTALEKRYNVSVPDDAIEDFYCVENIYRFLIGSNGDVDTVCSPSETF
jgi:acyl carrier protein